MIPARRHEAPGEPSPPPQPVTRELATTASPPRRPAGIVFVDVCPICTDRGHRGHRCPTARARGIAPAYISVEPVAVCPLCAALDHPGDACALFARITRRAPR